MKCSSVLVVLFCAMSLFGVQTAKRDQRSQASAAKNPPSHGYNPNTSDTSGALVYVKCHEVALPPPSTEPCKLLRQSKPKSLSVRNIIDLIGDLTPYSLKPLGTHQILIYKAKSSVADKSASPELLAKIESQIDELAKLGSFEIELKIPRFKALGDAAAKIASLNYQDFTVVAVGTDMIRVTSDTVPECDEWTRFLQDVRELAWQHKQVSPVQRLFYLNGTDVAAALGSGSGVSKHDDSQAGTSITVNAVGTQTSASAGKGSKGGASDATGNAKDSEDSDSAGQSSNLPAKQAQSASSTKSGSGTSGKSGSSAASGGPSTGSKPSASAEDDASDKTKTPASTVSPLPAVSDLLVFSEPTLGDDDSVDEKRRIVAAIDLPRPEMIVNVWSMQLSDKDQTRLRQQNQEIQTKIGDFNDLLKHSIFVGWSAVRKEIDRRESGFFDLAFYNYISRRYVRDTVASEPTSENPSQDFLEYREPAALTDTERKNGLFCPADQYCLGYSALFKPLKPKLLDLLLAIIASKEPLNTAKSAISAIDRDEPDKAEPVESKESKKHDCISRGLCPQRDPEANSTCQAQDFHKYIKGRREPVFYCFRQWAEEHLDTNKDPWTIGFLRGSISEFLFEYKMANLYPHEFSAYDLAISADGLNNALSPIIDAFNEDLTAYQKSLQSSIVCGLQIEKNSKAFSNYGLISVRAISGKETMVDTVTQSYLDTTHAPGVSELLSSMVAAQNAVPKVISANLGASAATTLVGALNAMQSSQANVGRGFRVTLLPRSLPDASSAELQVALNVEETSEPAIYSAGSASGGKDNLSRIGRHDTTTEMRVDSLRIFEVSSFYAQLQRSRSRFPILPIPGLEVPYIGSFVGIPLKPASEYHWSLAVLNAFVVPTAADLAFGTRFESDRIAERNGKDLLLLPTRSLTDLGPDLKDFHKRMVYCLTNDAVAKCDCSTITLANSFKEK